MKFGHLLVMALSLGCTTVLLPQDKQSNDQKGEPASRKFEKEQPNEKASSRSHGPIDILSDTDGVDVHPYLDRALSLIKTSWYRLIPESVVQKRGKVSIKLTISKDGRISDVSFADRSGDDVLDRVAYLGINSSSPLPPLPSDYTCKDIHLQIHFYYNLDVDADHAKQPPISLIPCVKSRIGYVQPVVISVSPVASEVVIGAQQQFAVKITGDSDGEVTWSVSGTGCSGLNCGRVSPQGLYVAPANLPNPPKVNVTVTLVSDPTEMATATVHLVQPPTTR